MADSPAQVKKKIYFSLDPEDWHGHPSESLWAEKLDNSPSDSVYCLLNSPFFTSGISYRDVVRAGPRQDGPGLQFIEVLDRSGHSTYMVLVPPICPDFDEYWERLNKLGCTYESMTLDTSFGKRLLYSIDVPESSNIYDVYEILEQGERANLWIFQEGHCGHALNNE